MPAHHVGWSHKNLGGASSDKTLTLARKLLARAIEDARYNNLGVNVVQQTLEDGTVLRADKIGDIPRLQIRHPEKSPRRAAIIGLDRFVVTPRWPSESGLVGYDPDVPQLWLDVPGISRPPETGWLTRWHTDAIAGYEDFEGQKAAYRVFLDRVAFPDGVPLAGNVDHVNAEGRRVSWYGPIHRGFAAPYVSPVLQFGPYVLMGGRVLLDASADADGHTAVLGAGLSGGSLYVVQCVAAFNLDLSAPTPSGGQGLLVAPVPAIPSGAEPIFGLYRYSVVAIPSAFSVDRLVVIPESRTRLWAGTFSATDSPSQANSNNYQPWFFNPDCTEASSFSAGLGVGVVRRVHEDPGEGPDYIEWVGAFYGTTKDEEAGDPPPAATPPPIRSWFRTLTIDDAHDSATLESVASVLKVGLSGFAGHTPLIREYDIEGTPVDLKLGIGAVASGDVEVTAGALIGDARNENALHLWFDGLLLPMTFVSGAAQAQKRTILHVEGATRTLITMRSVYDYTMPGAGDLAYPVSGGARYLEVWRAGERVHVETLPGRTSRNGPMADLDTRPVTFGDCLLPSNTLTASVEQAVGLYGIFMAEYVDNSLGPAFYARSRNLVFYGSAHEYAYQPYPQALTYAWYRFPSAGGEGGLPVTQMASDRPNSFVVGEHDGTSIHALYRPFAAATLGETVIWSGSVLHSQHGTSPTLWWQSLYGSTDEPLPDLTGTEGTGLRFHPLWRLGRFDLSPTED